MKHIYIMVSTLDEDMDERDVEDLGIELEERLNKEFNRANDCDGAHTIEVSCTDDATEHARMVNSVLQREAA